MKKTILAVSAICVFFLAGCNLSCPGNQSSDQIIAMHMFDNKIEVAYHTPTYFPEGTSESFPDESSIDEMKAVFDGAGYQTKVGNNLIFVTNTVNGNNFYYGLYKDVDDTSYTFAQLAAHIYKNETSFGDAIVPLHLTSVNCFVLDYFSPYMEKSVAYPITGTKADVVDFYRNCYGYKMTETEDTLTLSINVQTANYFSPLNEFSVVFGTANGQTTITITTD